MISVKVSARAIGEIIAVASVVASLVFVGLEFRQSTIASRATAIQELGIATSDMLLAQTENPVLNRAFTKAFNEPENITTAEQQLVIAWARGSLRLYETVYLQVELGLLEPEALNYLGWEAYRELQILRLVWPIVRNDLPENFAQFIEATWE